MFNIFSTTYKSTMSDSDESKMVSPQVLKRRAAVDRWKAANYDRYILPKRTLASRPEYKAHRREMYREKTDELKLLGILPRKRGRPQMYEGSEAIEMKRQRAREAMARHRLKKISQLQENDNHDSTSSPECESSDRSCDNSGRSA